MSMHLPLDQYRVQELWRLAKARNRSMEREPRTITLTDDELLELLLAANA